MVPSGGKREVRRQTQKAAPRLGWRHPVQFICSSVSGPLACKWPWASEADGNGRRDLKSQCIIKKGDHQLALFILSIQAPLSHVLTVCKN